MKGLNFNEMYHGQTHDLAAAGYQAVLFYLRSDRVSKDLVDRCHAVGIRCGFVYESGFPTDASYFTVAIRAKHDATCAVAVAELLGIPAGKQLFSAVDYDASPDDVKGPIAAYQAVFQGVVKAAGYLASVYGSGLVCETLVGLGLAHSGWLSGSRGWAGSEIYLLHAAIVQYGNFKFQGTDADADTVVDPAVLW